MWMDKQVIHFVIWFNPRYFVWVKRQPISKRQPNAHSSVHMSQVVIASQWELQLLRYKGHFTLKLEGP